MRDVTVGRVMARLAENSMTVVSIIFLVMNLDRLLDQLFLRRFEWRCWLASRIENVRRMGSPQAATMRRCLAAC